MITIDLDQIQSKSYQHIPQLTQCRVLLRVCLNVTIDAQGEMIDDTRYQESLKSIYQLKSAHKLIIVAHLWRPSGYNPAMSLKFLQSRISQDLGQPISFAPSVSSLSEYDHGIILLENIRFDPREESTDLSMQDDLAQELSSYADIFVNDAFADYRPSVSTYHINRHLPAYLWPLFVSEIQHLSRIWQAKRPFVAIIWGSKLSDKLNVVSQLLHDADHVIIWGAMAFTLMQAQWIDIGKSLWEPDKIALAHTLLEHYTHKIVLPCDFGVVHNFENPGNQIQYDDHIDHDMMCIDIGPKSCDRFAHYIQQAQTIIRNWPLGVCEWPASRMGTHRIAQAIVDKHDAYRMIGGWDSITAFHLLGYDHRHVDHICTGWGAMLSLIWDSTFPTLQAILDNPH